jgi:hypothetical protein
MVVSEKLDGTNASVHITPEGEFVTCSRNRVITPGDDNYGFSKWAHEHKEELMKLGEGSHFGEWWGQGIQRGYGLKEKRFSLFNPKCDVSAIPCVHIVPRLYKGSFNLDKVDAVLEELKRTGSHASEGFMQPEGVVVWHEAAGCYFKKTCKDDGISKSEADALHRAKN